MRPNNGRLLHCTTAVLLAALAILSAFSRTRDYENLLLAAPKPGYGVSVSMDALAELNEKCMMTYEVQQESVVQAGNSRYSVVLKGTNHTFPFVTRASVLSGGFFSEEVEELARSGSVGSASGQGPLKSGHAAGRVAILNEQAAFEMFGGVDVVGNELKIGASAFSISNMVYVVAGVINDGDSDNRNVYIPAEDLNKSPDTFLAVLDNKAGVTQAYAENEFKQAGITSTNYDFINLDTAAGIVREKAVAAVELLVCTVLFFVIRRSIVKLIEQFRNGGPKSIPAIAGTTVLAVGASALFLWAFTKCVESFIRWSGYDSLRNISVSAFTDKLQYLQSLELYTNALFIGFSVMLALSAISSLRRR